MKMPSPPPSKQKTIEIVAGPNGSGKTTFAEMLFRVRTNTPTFVNPDVIAAGIAPTNPDTASFAAGRILVNEIQTLLSQGKSLAFESTLSGRAWIPLLRKAKHEGYKIRIYFIALKNIQLNLQRIKTRVKNGGHNIPTKTVKRRHPRVFKNFWTQYKELADEWYLFDNSSNRPKFLLSKADFTTLPQAEQDKLLKCLMQGAFKP